MKYIAGVFYVLIALIIMLWAALSEFGGVTSIINENPNEPLRIVVMYGKVIVFYPFMSYLAFKLGRNGIQKFGSSKQSEVNAGI